MPTFNVVVFGGDYAGPEVSCSAIASLRSILFFLGRVLLSSWLRRAFVVGEYEMGLRCEDMLGWAIGDGKRERERRERRGGRFEKGIRGT